MEVGTHPSYKERKKHKRRSKSIGKEKQKPKSKILSVVSILGEQVRDNSGSCPNVGPSGVTACVLLWEHPRRLGVYLLLAQGTRRQPHHKVGSRPTQNQITAFQMPLCSTPPSRLSCGLRFWMWNASLIFRSLFQRARSIAFMPCQSISCGIDCSWTCSAIKSQLSSCMF